MTSRTLGTRFQPNKRENRQQTQLANSKTNTSAQVPVYFLNGKFDYRHMLDWAAPDIDCVHTVGPPLPMPEKVILE